VRCGGPVDLDRLGKEVTDGLAALGLPRPQVEVRAVERLERDNGPAKLRRFVPLGHEARDLEPVLSATG
jgi:hypothetical protein